MTSSLLLSLFVCIVVATAVAVVSAADDRTTRDAVAPDLSVGVLPEVFIHGGHFSIGQQLGYATKDSIAFRLKHSPSVYNLLHWVRTSSGGADAYDAMLQTANSTFPDYVSELEGIAYGSGADFQTLFVLNVRNELQSFKDEDEDDGRGSNEQQQHGVEHCSDYLMNNLRPTAATSTASSAADSIRSDSSNDGGEIVVGHNEDGGWESRDESALVTAHVDGGLRFTAFVYAGELPTDAFFWNSHGLIGTMNGLYPQHCLRGGLGRNFVSRHLLAAVDIDDAVSRATMPNQATGHSFNFASLHERRLINVEVAPNTAVATDAAAAIGAIGAAVKDTIFVVTPIEPISSSSDSIDSNVLFHANSYKFLQVPEQPSPSSAHRMARAAQLPPPRSQQQLLAVLGDTADADWPIYRTAVQPATTAAAVRGGDEVDTGYTLVTALFSLQFPAATADADAAQSTVTLFMSNPKTNAAVNITMPIAVQR